MPPGTPPEGCRHWMRLWTGAYVCSPTEIDNKLMQHGYTDVTSWRYNGGFEDFLAEHGIDPIEARNSLLSGYQYAHAYDPEYGTPETYADWFGLRQEWDEAVRRKINQSLMGIGGQGIIPGGSAAAPASEVGAQMASGNENARMSSQSMVAEISPTPKTKSKSKYPTAEEWKAGKRPSSMRGMGEDWFPEGGNEFFSDGLDSFGNPISGQESATPEKSVSALSYTNPFHVNPKTGEVEDNPRYLGGGVRNPETAVYLKSSEEFAKQQKARMAQNTPDLTIRTDGTVINHFTPTVASAPSNLTPFEQGLAGNQGNAPTVDPSLSNTQIPPVSVAPQERTMTANMVNRSSPTDLLLNARTAETATQAKKTTLRDLITAIARPVNSLIGR